MELIWVQLLVLAATGVFWWIARRDLQSRQSPTTSTAELEQLCATLEALVVDLEARAQAATQRLSAAEQQFQMLAQRLPMTAPLEAPTEEHGEETTDARYAPVYELLAAGVTDSGEIIRRTGLGQGEVDLILGLRARRAL